MVASPPSKQGDVPVGALTEPSGDHRNAVESGTVKFGSRGIKVDPCCRAGTVELQTYVLGTDRVSVQSAKREPVSDDQR